MTYSGNSTGTSQYNRIYVFDRGAGTGATQASFVKTIDTTGSTTDYVVAGGDTHGNTGLLQQYIGNELYENFTRTTTRTFTVMDETGGITTSIQTYTPDPRIHFGFYGLGGSTGATGFTANHMDHIHVKAENGLTYEGYVGRIDYGSENSEVHALGSSEPVFAIELLAYGVSGSDATDAAYSLATSGTFTNKTNGNTGIIRLPDQAYRVIDINSHKQKVLGQVSRRLDSANFVGGTIGDAGASQAVFYNSNDTQLINIVSTLLPAFAFGGSGASGHHSRVAGVGGVYSSLRQSEIFTMLAGVTGDINHVQSNGDGAIFGVTFNAVTGGSANCVSAFEEFAHHVLHNFAKNQNTRGQAQKKIIDKTNSYDIDQCEY